MRLRGARVLVTGGTGFVGRNLIPELLEAGAEVVAPTRAQYDLLEQSAVRQMMADVAPDAVVHLAGLVGGVLANEQRPADFYYQNLAMTTHVMHEAWRSGAGKFLTLIGGCSYPAGSPSPLSEDDLWAGYPYPGDAPYALAKRVAVVQAQAYRRQHGFNAVVLLPGNLYGPHDNFELGGSHVVPALVRKVHEAKIGRAPNVVAWGTGRPRRDFVYVGDACRAIAHALAAYDADDVVNISSGVATSIRELVDTVVEVVGYDGAVVWDSAKPDGTFEKVFSTARMREVLGVDCPTSLKDGTRLTYEWFAPRYSQGAVRL